MPRWLRWTIIFTVSACGLLAAGLFGFGRIASGLCGSTEVARMAELETGRDAVLYEYNCGATTGFATHVAILKPGVTPRRAGNVFVADTEHGAASAAEWGGPWAEVRWTAPDALLVRYDAAARVFTSETRVRGVTITYAPVSPPARPDTEQ